MNAVRSYLLRVVICSFVISLVGAIPLQKSVKRALTLCGGCLMILVVLRPLLGVEFSVLPEQLLPREWGTKEEQSDPDAVYRQLMEELITEQTLGLLSARAQELGVQAAFRVELAEDPASGQLVPWSVETSGALTPAQRESLSAYMSGELNVPAERQRWRIP